MNRKDRIDAMGATLLVGFSALLGLNQALVKLVNVGMSPVFQAGMRSAAAFLPVLIYAWIRRRKLTISDGSLLPGIVTGLLFAFEFFLLFKALDLTTVAHASILFYTMPVWVAVAAHFLIPGERMTRRRAFGLALAVAGVAVALAANATNQVDGGSLAGDLMALVAATGWAGIAIVARTTKMSRSVPEMQLLYQLAVSAPILLGLAWYSGETFREMTPFLWGIFAFQALVVVAAGFVLWFWILSVYPASDMASFAFLSPLFGVVAGTLMFGERLTLNIAVSMLLVGLGIYLVNSKRRRGPASAPGRPN